jgi:hypothetical protein
MTKSRGVGRGFGAGRPTSYKPEFAELVTGYCLLGAKEPQLAEIFGVNQDSIYEWKKRYPKFSEGIKIGREVADAKVAKSLYRKALEGDTVACIFWLKNRQPEQWRDQRDLRHSGLVTLAALVCGEDAAQDKPLQQPLKQIEGALEEE